MNGFSCERRGAVLVETMKTPTTSTRKFSSTKRLSLKSHIVPETLSSASIAHSTHTHTLRSFRQTKIAVAALTQSTSCKNCFIHFCFTFGSEIMQNQIENENKRKC